MRTMAFLALAGCVGLLVGCPGALDPAAGRSTPTGIAAGIYSGSNVCQWTFTEEGVEFPDNSIASISRVFSDNGLPVTMGQELAVGSRFTRTLGNQELEETVTGVNRSLNGLQFESVAVVDLACGNTCQFARDGVCDEVNSCPLGTDCSDCGSVTLTGFEITSYQTLTSGAVRRTFSVNLREEDAGLASFVGECTATLSK